VDGYRQKCMQSHGGSLSIVTCRGGFAHHTSFGAGPPLLQRSATDPRECQKPGALRRELDWLVAKASVQQRGSDLKHTVSTAGRPAHLPALVHAGVHQLIDGALGP